MGGFGRKRPGGPSSWQQDTLSSDEGPQSSPHPGRSSNHVSVTRKALSLPHHYSSQVKTFLPLPRLLSLCQLPWEWDGVGVGHRPQPWVGRKDAKRATGMRPTVSHHGLAVV